MEHLILGLYVLSLLACMVCLWFWYELESHKDHVIYLRQKLQGLDDRIQSLEQKRR